MKNLIKLTLGSITFLGSLLLVPQATAADDKSHTAKQPTVHHGNGEEQMHKASMDDHGAEDPSHASAVKSIEAHATVDAEAEQEEHVREAAMSHGKEHSDSHFHHTTATELQGKSEGLETELPWQIVLRQAMLAAKSHDYEKAEGLFGHAFLLSPPEEEQKEAYLAMAVMYEESGKLSKMAAIYEKFAHLFKEDARLAQIFMRLGGLYREMGAYDMAISRFYNVLNVTLSLEDDSAFEAYREISVQAQLDIAETYFLKGEFPEAEKFFKRLLFLDLNDKDMMNVMFKTNYMRYIQKDYASASNGLEDFLEKYPGTSLSPESHFMLTTCYNELNQPKNAVRQVLSLLNSPHGNSKSNAEIWQFWRKRTANQLAHEFYAAGDYLSALKIYQAMATLNKSPSWQWPAIYKIGLCFERLHMTPKAQEAYSLLATGEEWKDIKYTLTPSLKSIQEMAQWRLDHLKWNQRTKSRVTSLLEVAGQTANGITTPPQEEPTTATN